MRPDEVQGWQDKNELAWLEDMAREMGSVVEVGCWKGRSTLALAQNCKGFVFAVDHWRGSSDERKSSHHEATERDIYEDFRRTMADQYNVVALRMESARAAAFFRDESVDLVYIDGCHLYDDVKMDLMVWLPVARRMIAGHDRTMQGVQQALSELGMTISDGPGSIWYIEK